MQMKETDFAHLVQMVMIVVISKILQLLLTALLDSKANHLISCVYHVPEVILVRLVILVMVLMMQPLSQQYAQAVHMQMKSKLLVLLVQLSTTQSLVVLTVLQCLPVSKSILHKMTSNRVHIRLTVIGDKRIVSHVLMDIYALKRRMT